MEQKRLSVAINGYGRIGRHLLRMLWGVPNICITHINEVKGLPSTAALLTKYDSVYGTWDHEVTATDGNIVVDGSEVILYTSVADPSAIAWNVDIVLECTGKLKKASEMEVFLKMGARKVIVSRPVEGILNVVFGINQALYTPEMKVITAASCTTNCLAPVVKVLTDNFKIKHGVVTTIHEATNTQTVCDVVLSDPRRSRSCLGSLIPTTSGSAKAIGMIFPELQGKLTSLAVRVALQTASLVDCVFELEDPATAEEVNSAFRKAAEGPLKPYLGFSELPLVSADYVKEPRSAVVDGLCTMVVDGRCLKVMAWYDNEYGYSLRMAELVQYVADRM
eukprot:Colp12_sorted_trinity150504_noHs@1010